MLRCLVIQNPTSWSQQLSWVEYAHNSLPVSSTGLSPFECSLGYQPPIFPSLESEVAVPSAHAFIQLVWMKMFVSERLRSDVIRWGHCSNVACHPGIARTSFLVKQRFWCPSMARDIRDFVLACSVCARGKTSNRPPEGLLQPLSVPSRPWSHIALDFVIVLPGKYGCYNRSGPVLESGSFYSLAQITLCQGDSGYRCRSRLSCSWPPGRRGLRQMAPVRIQILERVLSFAGWASVSLSAGFHPQTNGQTEQANQDLERVLRCLVTQNPTSWSQQLSWVEYAHNSLPVLSTGLSPFECSLGYQPPIFPSLESEVPSAHAFILKWEHAPRPRPIATGQGPPSTS